MRRFWSFDIARKASGSGVSMFGDEARLAHQGEDPPVLRQVQRRLAGEAQRVAAAGLPLDEVRERSITAFWLPMKLSSTR